MQADAPTVADILALNGKRQLTKLRVESLDEAAAADEAGIDKRSVPPELITHRDFRTVCRSPFVVGGLETGLFITEVDYLRISFRLLGAGASAVYCGASLPIVRRLCDEGIPVVGLIPSRRTWTGGFKAVGRTCDSALMVFEQTRALEEADAFAAEIEVVPPAIAEAISKRTSMLMISMDAGAGCDAQYPFACDVLVSHDGHYPRHSKRYWDFLAHCRRLQEELVAAFRDYARDLAEGAFPQSGHLVNMADDELTRFLEAIGAPATN